MTVIWERRASQIKLPFFDNDSVYVWYGGQSMKLSGSAFGNGPAGFLVSPDQKQAIAMCHVEASISGGVLIDFGTGELTWQDGWIDWDKSRGWKPTRWHTTLEALSRDRLYEEMRSRDETRCKLVMEELELRGFTPEDVPALLNLLADSNTLDSARHAAAFRLYKLQPKDDASLSKIAAVAISDSSIKARLSAAWVLSELDPDCGDKVDIWRASRDEHLRDREIARIVNSWKSRHSASTVPSKR